MATIALQSAKCVKTISGNSPMTMIYPEAAGTQAFKTGEFVYLVAGLVTEIGSDPAIILGIAAQDAAGVVNTSIAVYIANEDNIFELNKCSNLGGAGTGATASATAAADVGKIFSIYRDTTLNIANAGLNTATGGAERLMCIGLSEKDVVGDTGGRLLCMVLGRNRQLFSTS